MRHLAKKKKIEVIKRTGKKDYGCRIIMEYGLGHVVQYCTIKVWCNDDAMVMMQ